MLEEPVQIRLAEVQVDERDAPARASEGDGEAGNRRRFPLLLQSRGDHDDPSLAIEIQKLEIGAQLLHCFGRRAPGLDQDRQLPGAAKPPRRRGQPGEQRQTEDVLDLALRSDALVERLSQEREADPMTKPSASPSMASRVGRGLTCQRPPARLDHLRLVAQHEQERTVELALFC